MDKLSRTLREYSTLSNILYVMFFQEKYTFRDFNIVFYYSTHNPYNIDLFLLLFQCIPKPDYSQIYT